jgi:hypothetical protein
MLEELYQHNMASLEKLRHLSLSTATKSIQMKKGLLLGDLSQAELFHTAERTALIMFFEGDTIIRQGDSRRQHGPYAQQVSIFQPRALPFLISRGFRNKFDGCVPRHAVRWRGTDSNAPSIILQTSFKNARGAARDTWQVWGLDLALCWKGVCALYAHADPKLTARCTYLIAARLIYM